MKELIRTRIRRDSLCYFTTPKIFSTVQVLSSLQLRHRHLSHPSEKVVRLLAHGSSSKDH